MFRLLSFVILIFSGVGMPFSVSLALSLAGLHFPACCCSCAETQGSKFRGFSPPPTCTSALLIPAASQGGVPQQDRRCSPGRWLSIAPSCIPAGRGTDIPLQKLTHEQTMGDQKVRDAAARDAGMLRDADAASAPAAGPKRHLAPESGGRAQPLGLLPLPPPLYLARDRGWQGAKGTGEGPLCHGRGGEHACLCGEWHSEGY